MTQRSHSDYLIDTAINIAARADDFSHLARVASRFDGGSTEGLAAWLHDSVEDGFATEAELRDIFPAEVVDIVMDVSKRDGEKYSDFITRIIESGNRGSIKVKLGDVQVNLNRAKVDRFSMVPRYTEARTRLIQALVRFE